ncbi:hypothetical protein [Corynebacterium senegalense]|uniref:hypothetical protein n=1 Tax=Corynebacterium senegalense TaxID=2080750 RepID=UPI000E209EA5|nr:hypothetical protein [Corynebacterium senegalense]
MKRRSNGDQSRDISAHLQPLIDDDAFLTALSRGEDPSGGSDELAGLFLELRSEVEAQMPPAPEVEGAEVASLDDAPSRRHRTSPWAAGLIGAAAATVLVAGTGAALYGAAPGSPLWGPASAVFGDRAAVVELASTLDELEAANNSGDEDAARGLLEQAQLLMGSIKPGAASHERRGESGTTSVTVTERTTTRSTKQPQAPAPASPTAAPQETVTERVTETVTVTVTPAPGTGTTRPSEPVPSNTATVPAQPSTGVSTQPVGDYQGEPGDPARPSTGAQAAGEARGL